MGYIESNLVRDEHIVYVGRKHVILMIGQIITEIILIGLTLVAFYVVGMVFKKYDMMQNAIQVIVYGALGLATTVLVVSGVLDYLKWYNDCVVITNRRMMRFEGLFNRHMVESILDKINDVALNQTFWGRLFGYGDVTVLTAAESGIQEMRNIAKPFEFKKALFYARSSEYVNHDDEDDDHHRNDSFGESHVVVPQPAPIPPRDSTHDLAPDLDDDLGQEESLLDDQSDDPSHAPTPPHGISITQDVSNQTLDDEDELERATILHQLEVLHAKGYLDDEEFHTKRQRLYGKDV